MIHKSISPRCSHPFKIRNTLKQQERTLFGFVRNALGMEPPPSKDDPTPANRFHPWDSSPAQDLRTRAATIRARALCPVTKKEINFVCPYSGIPTHHSKEAWEADEEYHRTKKYETLKKVNIYEHDLRSGRPFPEFDFPSQQEASYLVNLKNWDTFFYTRSFYSMDTEFQLAAVTKMLSYPLTIASIIYQYSTYALKPKGPLTLEGLKSLAALRYSLYTNERTSTLKDRPIRIFLVGARAESQLPPTVWKQLGYLFPDTEFEFHFIGPEAYYDRTKQQYLSSPRAVNVRFDPQISFHYHTEYFHTLHEAQDFFPYDPYLDVFFLYHPGFGAPEAKDHWIKSVPGLLDSKCAIFVTGYHETDVTRDYNWLIENFEDDLDILLEKRENVFSSTKWELNDLDPHEVYQFNQQLFGFRGKRYHAIKN